jgi:DNA-binding NarL/FixJ family response regulator
MTRVLLVDDQPLVLAGLRRILEPEPDLDIVADCTDGDEVAEAVTRLAPDVVLMDVRMKRIDGVEATRDLTAQPGSPPVLVLTTFGEDDVVAAALSAGAAGFILKDAMGEDLIRATREVAAGRSWLDPAITASVLATFRHRTLPRAAARARHDHLTDREQEVLELIAGGATNTEIASALTVTEATVKTHISHIFAKLHLRDRAAAIVFAYEHGIVEMGQDGTAAR